MSYETSDNTAGTTNAASDEQEVHSSASALALGLGLLFGGVAVMLLGGLFVGWNGVVTSLMWIFGGMAIIAGVIQFIVGVYLCADNIDRAAKVLIDGQRTSQKSDDSTAL